MKFLTVVIFLLVFSNNSYCEIFRWVDEDGIVQFSDKTPNELEAEQLQLETNSYTSVTYEPSIYDTGKQVIMYSTARCGYCKKARKYFKTKNIALIEYDIDKDTEAKKRYVNMGAKGVPVIFVGTRRMNGFSVGGFEKLYNL